MLFLEQKSKLQLKEGRIQNPTRIFREMNLVLQLIKNRQLKVKL